MITDLENSMNFIATGDNVLVEIIIPEKTKGGIIYPQNSNNPKEYFKSLQEIKPMQIISMGKRAEQVLADEGIKRGSFIYIQAGIEASLMKIKGKSYFMVNSYDIIGKAAKSIDSDEDKAQLKLDLKASPTSN